MTIEEVIARINELYHKSKEQPLTEEELKEQKELRTRYISNVKKNLTAQLNNVVIDRPDGTHQVLKKKK